MYDFAIGVLFYLSIFAIIGYIIAAIHLKFQMMKLTKSSQNVLIDGKIKEDVESKIEAKMSKMEKEVEANVKVSGSREQEVKSEVEINMLNENLHNFVEAFTTFIVRLIKVEDEQDEMEIKVFVRQLVQTFSGKDAYYSIFSNFKRELCDIDERFEKIDDFKSELYVNFYQYRLDAIGSSIYSVSIENNKCDCNGSCGDVCTCQNSTCDKEDESLKEMFKENIGKLAKKTSKKAILRRTVSKKPKKVSKKTSKTKEKTSDNKTSKKVVKGLKKVSKKISKKKV